ncbi:MAG: hypothetical protein ACI86X_002314 [Moritella sp.]|jgi:uncharacterized protein YifE (UPF0438 family)
MMRSINTFSDEAHFPLGFQQTGCFTAEEADMLENFGLTMQGLQEGSLIPESAAEHYFLAELDGEFSATSDLARCWCKYGKKVARCERSPTSKTSNKRKDPIIHEGINDSINSSYSNDSFTDDDSFADDDSSVIDDNDEFLIDDSDDDLSADAETELDS